MGLGDRVQAVAVVVVILYLLFYAAIVFLPGRPRTVAICGGMPLCPIGFVVVGGECSRVP